MKLLAQVDMDGTLKGLIATPDGEGGAMLASPPGVQTYEVAEHEFTGEHADPEKLSRLLESHSVSVTRGSAKLTPRRQG